MHGPLSSLKVDDSPKDYTIGEDTTGASVRSTLGERTLQLEVPGQEFTSL